MVDVGTLAFARLRRRPSDDGRQRPITVQAVYGGQTATLDVTFTATAELAGLSIIGKYGDRRQRAQYTATATYSDGGSASDTGSGLVDLQHLSLPSLNPAC